MFAQRVLGFMTLLLVIPTAVLRREPPLKISPKIGPALFAA